MNCCPALCVVERMRWSPKVAITQVKPSGRVGRTPTTQRVDLREEATGLVFSEEGSEVTTPEHWLLKAPVWSRQNDSS